MPKITKQTTSKLARLPKSILEEAIDVADLVADFDKIVIYGQNRVGKTTLACQWPKPLVIVSFEPTQTGGATSVKKIPGVKILRVNIENGGSRRALQIASELAESAYKTVVVDTATSYQDLFLQEILDLPKLPEQLNWGTVNRDQYRERSEKTKEGLRPFLDLPMNTIILAKEKDHNRDKEVPKILGGFQLESWIASDLGGATVGWLHDCCDCLTRLWVAKETTVTERKIKIGKKVKIKRVETETGRFVRRLRTLYHPNYAAGLRSADPDSVPEYIEEPSYAKIRKVIDGDWNPEEDT